MKIAHTDIDIDTYDRDKLLKILGGVPASMDRDGKITKHNTGVYFVDVPTIPGTDQSAFDHKVADQLGYFKLDFLNVNIYSQVKSRQHLAELFAQEPPWHRLQDQSFVDQTP